MTRLPNTRHERFALGVASGVPASRAYRAAGYSARATPPRSMGAVCSGKLRCAIGLTS